MKRGLFSAGEFQWAKVAHVRFLPGRLRALVTKRPDLRWLVVLTVCAIVLVTFAIRGDRDPFFLSKRLIADFAQDYIGAKALLSQEEEMYPVLGPAFERIGLKWKVEHRSTHPPTTFLLALPLAGVSYPVALRIWAAAMTLCLVAAGRAFGLPWRWAILAALLSLTWPPTRHSTQQYTAIWLLGLALGYRFRAQPFLSGVLVGFASLPKFLAASALLAHLRRRQWTALAGFAAVWLTAILALVLVRPDSFAAYLEGNKINFMDQILRGDNGALAVVAWRLAGGAGLAAVGALAFLVTWAGLRSRDDRAWASFTWLGIALLPIAWVYSLLPLLPWLLRVVLVGRVLPCAFGVMALLSPLFGPAPTKRPWSVALCIVMAGIAFFLQAIGENPAVADVVARRFPWLAPFVVTQGEQPQPEPRSHRRHGLPTARPHQDDRLWIGDSPAADPEDRV